MPAESGVFWDNGRENTVIDYRLRPGTAWTVLDVDAAMGALSGGRAGVESDWSRGFRTGSRPVGTRRTGNPERYTADVMIWWKTANFLSQLFDTIKPRTQCDCVDPTIDIRIRNRCGDLTNKTEYNKALVLNNGASTSFSTDVALADMTDGVNEKVKQQESISALYLEKYQKLTHLDISGTIADVQLNKVIHVCDDEWVAVGNADPASYLGQPVPKVYITTNNGATWVERAIVPFFSGNATDVLKVGELIIVVSPQNGVAYAQYSKIKAGDTSAWALATGFTGNFPNAASATDNNNIYFVGNGGRIWKSSDGGFSVAAVATSVTAQNLTTVHFASDDIGAIGGANGTLVRFRKGVYSLVPISGLSAAINVVQIPPERLDEVYVGTANGNVYVSENFDETTVTFTTRGFFEAGNGQIRDIKFAGYLGSVMFVAQQSALGTARILRDLSGGFMANDVEVVGDYTSPSNFGFNSIATAELDVNSLMVVGNIHETYGYIGYLQG